METRYIVLKIQTKLTLQRGRLGNVKAENQIQICVQCVCKVDVYEGHIVTEQQPESSSTKL